LAEQIALAGRRVALKISRAKGDESQTLAQLQHTHIVPVYSAHVDPASGLQLLVMPYFGGTTLERLLEKAGLQADRHATGRSLVTALDELAPDNFLTCPHGSLASATGNSLDRSLPSMSFGPGSLQPTTAGGASWLLRRLRLTRTRSSRRTLGATVRNLLEQCSYRNAVTWIAARLAEALAHAHQRGILHRDVKPSNVLIASDGQPMLLDFNLAHDVKTADCGAAAYVGGTLPYMAPEHLDAFNSQNPTPASAVDERSDIYSLGVVLFEMLAGRPPFEPEKSEQPLPVLLERMALQRRRGAPSPRAINPAVTRSLDAVVRRCLESDPARRYQQASALAEDLQRELDDRPLLHTREPSLSERARKWVRRHPRLATGGSVAALSGAALLGVTGLVLVIGGRLAGHDAESRWLRFQQGLVRAQLLVHTGQTPDQNLAEGQRVCEQTLALFDVLSDQDWMHRPHVARLSANQRAELPESATELVLLLARVRAEQARLAKSTTLGDPLLKEAVRMLDRAERFNGDAVPRALYQDRSDYRRLLGDADKADADWDRAQATPVRTARDHYLLATAMAVEKHYEAAAKELEAALRVDPKHFWSHFELGICYDQLGRYAEAVAVYGCCVALWPDFAWTYLNRGLAYSRQGKWDAAVQDYSKAIESDAAFGDAYVNRGLAHLNQHRYVEAVSDLSRAVELGRRGGTVWAARAAAHASLGDWAAARSDYDSALRESPGDDAILLSRGFAFAANDPDQALDDFGRVLEHHPTAARAHYGRAFVLSKLPDRNSEAIEAAEQAIAADAKLVTARCALAVLLARAGDWEHAIQEAEIAVRQDSTGPVCYAAACTYALASRNAPQCIDRAFEMLQRALDQNYGRSQLGSDPDLEPLRQHPRFATIGEGCGL
jgi:tetratricopeptide (TPR) repeat protein